jgi:hypothetical protein
MLGKLMPEHPINDPKHWLKRAKEARALAEQMGDPEVSASSYSIRATCTCP